MGKATEVVSKVPWKKVFNIGGKVGTVLIIASGISKAADIDENTQKACMKLASVFVKNKVES